MCEAKLSYQCGSCNYHHPYPLPFPQLGCPSFLFILVLAIKWTVALLYMDGSANHSIVPFISSSFPTMQVQWPILSNPKHHVGIWKQCRFNGLQGFFDLARFGVYVWAIQKTQSLGCCFAILACVENLSGETKDRTQLCNVTRNEGLRNSSFLEILLMRSLLRLRIEHLFRTELYLTNRQKTNVMMAVCDSLKRKFLLSSRKTS